MILKAKTCYLPKTMVYFPFHFHSFLSFFFHFSTGLKQYFIILNICLLTFFLQKKEILFSFLLHLSNKFIFFFLFYSLCRLTNAFSPFSSFSLFFRIIDITVNYSIHVYSHVGVMKLVYNF